MKLFIISRSLLLALALGLQTFLIIHIKTNVDRNTALKATTEKPATQPTDTLQKVLKETSVNEQPGLSIAQR